MACLITPVTTGISLARSRGEHFRARLVTPMTTGNQVKKFLSHLPFNFRNFGFGFGFPKVDFLQLVGLFLRLWNCCGSWLLFGLWLWLWFLIWFCFGLLLVFALIFSLSQSLVFVLILFVCLFKEESVVCYRLIVLGFICFL